MHAHLTFRVQETLKAVNVHTHTHTFMNCNELLEGVRVCLLTTVEVTLEQGTEPQLNSVLWMVASECPRPCSSEREDIKAETGFWKD